MQILLAVLVLISSITMKPVDPKVQKIADEIEWLGQATVRIHYHGLTIYIDPYQLKDTDRADIILITHPHQDHWSKADVKKIITDKTILIAPQACLDEAMDLPAKEKIASSPGFTTTKDGIEIKAVPAYNAVKTKFHPKSNNWVGYILRLDGVKVYHTGDTERIPEMKNLKVDIIMLPLGQTYTMNSVEEAAEAALDVNASIAIPIHYGLYEGTKADAEKFKELLNGKIKVEIK